MRPRTRFIVVCLAAAALAPLACAAPPELATDDAKTLYALGLAMSKQLGPFDFTEEELSYIQAGLADGILGHETKVAFEEYAPKIDPYMRARLQRVADAEKEAGAAFRAEQAKLEGAETLPSGLIYEEIAAGDGPSPGPTDTVKIHYHGTLRDGTVFDSSREKGTPATFRLDGVIPCFSEGVQKMKVGGKARLVCPPELAYGDRGSPPNIGPGQTLVFEVELLEIVSATPPAPEPPPAP